MCGIAGLISAGPLPDGPRIVAGMTRMLRHRGPDGEGFVCIDLRSGAARFAESHPHPPQTEPLGASVVFGHRRLSIIDLSRAANQPMTLPEAPMWISYNGEIYNYVELREELGTAAFATKSDTEVILRAWQRWGAEECLRRLNGMFAFALWDGRDVWLARDRFGIKPLYYLQAPGMLLFASEIKAFVFGAELRLDLEPASVAEYFTFQNLFQDHSFFKGVRLLEPGRWLRIRCPYDGTLQQGSFNGDESGQSTLPDPESVRRSFEHAVRINLRSDVELGSYLSGGLDTTSIVALSHQSGLHTFTCGYDMAGVPDDERGFDESRLAALAALRFGTIHHAEKLGADDVPALAENTLWHLEEPRVGISVQNYYICSKIAERVKVVLSGTGGDELFGGYTWRYARVLHNAAPFDDAYHDEWVRLIPDTQKAAFFSDQFLASLGPWSSRDAYDSAIGAGAPADPLARALHFDRRTFLHGLLVVEDRLSMAHSLESRVPLLDNDLAALARTLPVAALVRAVGDRVEGKVILREAMAGRLPPEILAAPKQGFIPPFGHWLRTSLAEWARELLTDAGTAPFFADGLHERLLREHQSGAANHRALLWSLISFELMHRMFIERQPPEALAEAA